MDVKSSGGLNCPRCRGPVAVGTNPVAFQFGILGMIISALMTTYACPKCGPIPFEEFPPEAQAEARSNMWTTILVALGILVLIIGVIVAIIVWPR